MGDNLKLIRDITKDFKEVQSLITEHKALKKQIRTVDRKLKTIETKYSFLTDIISIGGHDTIIEIAAKRLLKSAGFTDVRHLKNIRPRREDVQIWCEDCLILIECKGTSKRFPSDDVISPIKKYIDHRANIVKSKMPVFGFTILNHDNSKRFDKRESKPIDKDKAEYVKAGQYGIITSIELVHGFILLKNNNISFEEFKNTIKQYGLITF